MDKIIKEAKSTHIFMGVFYEVFQMGNFFTAKGVIDGRIYEVTRSNEITLHIIFKQLIKNILN
jgi:hypothetical protein